MVKDERVLARKNQHRLLPLLKTLDSLQDVVVGSAVADKVIGRAAAMVYVVYGIKQIYTPLICRGAQKILQEAGIICETEKVVPHILDARREKPYPMEQLISKIDDPEIGKKVIFDYFINKGLL